MHVKFLVFTVQAYSALYIVYCTVYSALYSVQCTVLSGCAVVSVHGKCASVQ